MWYSPSHSSHSFQSNMEAVLAKLRHDLHGIVHSGGCIDEPLDDDALFHDYSPADWVAAFAAAPPAAVAPAAVAPAAVVPADLDFGEPAATDWAPCDDQDVERGLLMRAVDRLSCAIPDGLIEDIAGVRVESKPRATRRYAKRAEGVVPRTNPPDTRYIHAKFTPGVIATALGKVAKTTRGRFPDSRTACFYTLLDMHNVDPSHWPDTKAMPRKTMRT